MKLQQLYRYWGMRGLVAKFQYKFSRRYARFIKSEKIPTKEAMQAQVAIFEYRPLISIITPIYEPDLRELAAYFSSLLEMNGYEHLELCLVNDGTDDAALESLIAKYQKLFPEQIKYQKNPTNQGIAQASNDALKLATGTYVAFVDQDDVVAPHAFFEYVQAAQSERYDFFYADEDMISQDGKRFNPSFKAAWSPHTLLSRMYVNHLSMYKKSIIDTIGGLRPEFDGAQDYDLLLRASKHFVHVYHSPKILYHWRTSKDSIATSIANKQYIYERAEKALKEHLATQGLQAQVKHQADFLIYQIRVEVPQATVNTIVFHVQGTQKDATTSFSSLLQNLRATESYHIYVIDEQQLFKMPHYHGTIKVTTVRDVDTALRELRGRKDVMSEQVLFLSSRIAFANHETLDYLTQLMQLPEVSVLAPTVVNQEMIICEAGRIIGHQDALLFASFGVPFGANDYFGNNLSLVNYSFVSPDCFLMKTDIFMKANALAHAETFMELLINLRLENFFYCVNVGNVYVTYLAKAGQRFERIANAGRLRELFYNENLSQNLLLLYKIKDASQFKVKK